MRLVFACIFATSLLLATNARAQPRPCPPSREIEARISFIRSALRENARHAQTWSSGWGLFGVGVASGSIALAAASETSHDRIVWLAQGLPALGFPALMLIDPLQVMSDDRDLERLTQERGTSSCEVLRVAEIYLQKDARDEKTKTNLFAHALGILANVASSAVIVIGTGDWGAALLNGAGGIVVSEANLWTLPTGAANAASAYHARSFGVTIPW
ncbi:MAG: hypothetical protein ACRELY_25485 [Polyangiaceae bacterium]